VAPAAAANAALFLEAAVSLGTPSLPLLPIYDDDNNDDNGDDDNAYLNKLKRWVSQNLISISITYMNLYAYLLGPWRRVRDPPFEGDLA
jgi:hypothetical protein